MKTHSALIAFVSAVVSLGIDPTTNAFLSSQMTADLINDMRAGISSYLPYSVSIYYDINGKQRATGTSWDLGALTH
jgi:hypothetical protein